MEKCKNSAKTKPLKQFLNFIPSSSEVPTDIKQKMKQKQAKFVAGTASSFKLAENDGLVDLVQFGIEIGHRFGMLNARAVMSGRKAIKKEVFTTVEGIHEKLRQTLLNCEAISLTSDIWSDPINQCSFLDVTCFFVPKGTHVLKHQILRSK